MSVTRVQKIGCTCGCSFDALVFISLNALRHPEFRQALLDRNLHVFRCPDCDRQFMVETTLGYIDLDRRQLMSAFSEADRHNERACSELLMDTYRQTILEGPAWLAAQADRFLVRACFGLEELREKVVIDEAGLHDLPIEVMKGDLLAADPWFIASRVVTLRLDHVEGDELYFWPSWFDRPPAGSTPPPVIVSRELYDTYASLGEAELLRRRPGIASGPHVNLLRLANPTADSLTA